MATQLAEAPLQITRTKQDDERARSLITPEVQATFDADGVVHVPRTVSDSWVERILKYADSQIATPGDWVTDTNPGAPTNRLFTSRYRWRVDPFVADFVANAPVSVMAATLARSNTARFYFDHLLIKEPHTQNPTPWHQDIGYWPFMGKQIVSAWVAATPVTVDESSLEFIRSSHAWGRYFTAKSFDGKTGWAEDTTGEPMPDVATERAANPDAYDIVGFEVEPGDALFFSAWAVHGSPANEGNHRRVAFSTRWLGDDVTWYPHPGSDPAVTDDDTTDVSGELLRDDDRFPLVYSR